MNEQMDLLAFANRRGLHRHDHDQTAIDAAAQIESVSGRQRRIVLGAIRQSGPDGLTEEETSARTGLAANSIRPRRRELEALGLIAPSEYKRPTRSGRQARAWVAK
jgi:hypothetical protein